MSTIQKQLLSESGQRQAELENWLASLELTGVNRAAFEMSRDLFRSGFKLLRQSAAQGETHES